MRKLEGCPLPISQIGGSQVLINAVTGNVGTISHLYGREAQRHFVTAEQI